MSSDADVIRRARMRVAEKITDLIGDTPIVRLQSFEKDTPGVEIWAKCEFFNPGGSVKDRAAYQMIRDAIRTGLLAPGKTIIDSTSGNTGVAYSLIGGAMGFPVTLVMPGNVSWARRKITEAFGTKLIFSDPMEGSDGAIRLCRKIVDENPGHYFYPDQYSNLSNPLAHYNTTGREIWEQTEGRVTHFVTGIGTTGTVMGTGRRLKEYKRDIEVYAVEPDGFAARARGPQAHGELDRAADLSPGRARRRAADGHRRGLGRVRTAGQARRHAGRPFVGRVAGGRRPDRQAPGRGRQAGRDRDVVPRPRGALLRGAPGKAQVTDKVG